MLLLLSAGFQLRHVFLVIWHGNRARCSEISWATTRLNLGLIIHMLSQVEKTQAVAGCTFPATAYARSLDSK